MKRASLITLALLSALSASHAAWAVDYPLPPANSRLIGENQFWTVQDGDRNLQAIARRFDTAAMLILEANDTIAPVQPKPGTQVLIPSQMLLPDVPREGIVVNLAELRLYYFPKPAKDEQRVVVTVPIGKYTLWVGYEQDRRAGTENVPLIVGMAKAFTLAEAERAAEGPRLRLLRDQLIGSILESIDNAYLTGAQSERLDHLASFILPGAEAETLLIALDLAGIAASSGSACASGSQRTSHVLAAISISPADARCALRFSLGRSTTVADIRTVTEKLPDAATVTAESIPWTRTSTASAKPERWGSVPVSVTISGVISRLLTMHSRYWK